MNKKKIVSPLSPEVVNPTQRQRVESEELPECYSLMHSTYSTSSALCLCSNIFLHFLGSIKGSKAEKADLFERKKIKTDFFGGKILIYSMIFTRSVSKPGWEFAFMFLSPLFLFSIINYVLLKFDSISNFSFVLLL